MLIQIADLIFKTLATISGEKERETSIEHFDTNSHCSSLITYGRQFKDTLEYTGMQLTPTEIQKLDN